VDAFNYQNVQLVLRMVVLIVIYLALVQLFVDHSQLKPQHHHHLIQKISLLGKRSMMIYMI